MCGFIGVLGFILQFWKTGWSSWRTDAVQDPNPTKGTQKPAL
jgi:hypothetical protein